jgi:acid phosphatase family membrane protein YuiD
MNDKTALIFYIGIISLQYIVKFLKNIIKEDRPIKKNTYGMPSTKSATLFFIIGFLILKYKYENYTILKLFFLAFVGVLYKLYFKEHSIKQIIAGGLLGLLYSYIIYNLI